MAIRPISLPCQIGLSTEHIRQGADSTGGVPHCISGKVPSCGGPCWLCADARCAAGISPSPPACSPACMLQNNSWLPQISPFLSFPTTNATSADPSSTSLLTIALALFNCLHWLFAINWLVQFNRSNQTTNHTITQPQNPHSVTTANHGS